METVKDLAKDLVEGFEHELSLNKVEAILETIIKNGDYTLQQLWVMNNKDSTDLYHLMSYYGDFSKK